MAGAALHAIESRVDLTKCPEKSGPSASFFRRNVHPAVDGAQDELAAARTVFYEAAAALNAAVGAEHFSVETSVKAEGIQVTVTAKRWAAAVESGAAAKAVVPPWFCGADASIRSRDVSAVDASGVPAAAATPAAAAAPSKGSGGNRRLDHPAIGQEASDRVARASELLAAELTTCLQELIAEVARVHASGVAAAVRQLEALDVAAACAHNVRAMRHVRPTLMPRAEFAADDPEEDSTAGDGLDARIGRRPRRQTTRAFVRARALRHPIIESMLLDRREAFVPNDVALGCDGVSGMLLYGVNAVGKSSTMKAVGLAVVMAQAGMFVAADGLELAPFSELYTRIGLRDDIARGHSTFVVEMLELRAILTRSGPGSLAIGDELCAGTEAPSALAIVGAGVVRLAKRGVAFVFATHLHELVKIPQVAALTDIRVAHLSVHCDPATGRLVLDRRLAPGTGPPTYGLEVCRSLDMDPEFLRVADRIRRFVLEVPDDLVSERRSKYNTRVVLDWCLVCGATGRATHHIDEQAKADPSVKNRKYNLVPVCQQCHDEHHAGVINIEGFKMTSDGLKLMWTATPAASPPPAP